jgi:hypothetical protein
MLKPLAAPSHPGSALPRESRRETALFDEESADPGLIHAGVIHRVWPAAGRRKSDPTQVYAPPLSTRSVDHRLVVC